MKLNTKVLTVFFTTILFWCGSSPLNAAKLKTIVLDDSYDHARFAPIADIERRFAAFTVSFDSKDDDDGDGKPDLRRTPEWVAQHIKRTKEPCLDTKERPRKWFTDQSLFESGVAPNDDSYRNSGFDRGHMASKLLAARVSENAEWNTFTLLNAVPQLRRFNRQIWSDLEYLTGAWAQVYGEIWVMQGPVFGQKSNPFTIGDLNERKVAVPYALYKIVIRNKTNEEKASSAETEKNIPEVLVFLYPQLGPGYYSGKAHYNHARFLTSLKEVERVTGLQFFSNLDNLGLTDKALKRIRSARANSLWPIEKPSGQPNVNVFITGCPN